MKRRAAVLVLLVVAVALGIASASSLGVGSDSLAAADATHPCPGTATARPAGVVGTSATGVALTLPAGCGTRPVQVTVLAGGSVVATGSATLTGTGTVPTGAYTATPALTVRATVSGWALPTTWSSGPPYSCRFTDGSTATCSAVVTVVTAQRPAGAASATYYDITVTGSSGPPRPWEITLNLAHPFFGQPPTTVGNTTTDATIHWDGTTNDVDRTNGCSDPPSTLVVAGVNTPAVNENSNFRFVGTGNNKPRTFSLVVDAGDDADLIWSGCP